MPIDPPTSIREALHQAALEIGNLRRRIPGAKAGELLDVFDKVEWLWMKQDGDQFPFNVLIGEMNAIKAELRENYAGELDLEVNRRSPMFDQIVGFDLRISIYSEIVVLNPIYRGLDKRLQHIEGILPSRNYALRDLLDDLRPSFNLKLKQRIENALHHFEAGQYESTLSECGKAEGILSSHFRTLAASLGVSGVSFNEIRNGLTSKHDAGGFSLSKGGRLELLVLSMLETLHYFRNLGAHDRAEETAEEKLPEWQVQRREYFTQKPEYARLALVLTTQIALELQALLDHQGNPI